MATRCSKDFPILELDASTEIVANTVHRRRDRKLREYLASQITFIQGLFSLVECLVPGCRGHQRFGVSTTDNVAVFFRHHDVGREGIYVPYRNPLCKPLRVPQDGDTLINGIRWDSNSSLGVAESFQSIFDCLLANLKFQTLLKGFCLECIFMHTSGLGLLLERLLKTLLLHVVTLGRYLERETFAPTTFYEQGMTLKCRRVYWDEKNRFFRYNYLPTPNGFKEEILPVERDVPANRMPMHLKRGPFLDLDFSVLRHLNLVSQFNVVLQCGCNTGRPRIEQAYIGVLRRNHRSNVFNLAPAKWDSSGNGYEDPLWLWSLFGSYGSSLAISRPSVAPLASLCPGCQNLVSIRDVQVPETTWLFMAEMAEPLAKQSLEGLSAISTYMLGGVTFKLAFVLLFNQSTGCFTSMNYHQGAWSYYDDSCGGIFKSCRADKVRYKDRTNLRAFYIRQTESNAHQCLTAATNRLKK